MSWLRAFGVRPRGERLKAMQASPQWRGGRFRFPVQERMNLWRVLRSVVHGSRYRAPSQPPPVEAVDPARLRTPPASGLRLTWFGHSSALVEIDGFRVLIDPVWGPRASPSAAVGPKRFFEPPLALKDLPRPDAVVLSHDHYDHLDEPTIRALRGWDTLFLAPLGVGAHLEYWGVPPERVIERDWWGEVKLGGLTLACLPARHFSGRTFLDRNRTLWCGWALVGPHHRVYYSGDTALFDGIEAIGEKYGPFDASLMETGAYDPSWPDVHIGPEQAVEAWRRVRGGLYLPVHWGTFTLSVHGWTEPAERLLAVAGPAGMPLAIPRPGQSVEPAHPPKLERWWPQVPWRTAEETPVNSTGLDPK